MEDDFEIVQVSVEQGLFKKETETKYAFKNKRTGKISEQRFTRALGLSEGWGVVVVDGKWTYFNPNTGKIADQKFDYAIPLYEGWGIVKIEGKWTYFNPNAEKLCKHRFVNEPGPIENGLGVVPFVEEMEVGGLDHKVELYQLSFINPDADYVFKSRFNLGEQVSVQEALCRCPEDFEQLPTPYFRDLDKVVDFGVSMDKSILAMDIPEKEKSAKRCNARAMVFNKINKEFNNLPANDKEKIMDKIGEKKPQEQAAWETILSRKVGKTK